MADRIEAAHGRGRRNPRDFIGQREEVGVWFVTARADWRRRCFTLAWCEGACADDHKLRHRARAGQCTRHRHTSKTPARAKKGDVRQCVVAMGHGATRSMPWAGSELRPRADLTCNAHPQPTNRPRDGEGLRRAQACKGLLRPQFAMADGGRGGRLRRPEFDRRAKGGGCLLLRGRDDGLVLHDAHGAQLPPKPKLLEDHEGLATTSDRLKEENLQNRRNHAASSPRETLESAAKATA